MKIKKFFAAVMALCLVKVSLSSFNYQTNTDVILSSHAADTSVVYNYKWHLEPSVKADDIIVSSIDEQTVDWERIEKICSGFTTDSSYNFYEYSYLLNDDTFSIIDYDGNVVESDPSYNAYYTCNSYLKVFNFENMGFPGYAPYGGFQYISGTGVIEDYLTHETYTQSLPVVFYSQGYVYIGCPGVESSPVAYGKDAIWVGGLGYEKGYMNNASINGITALKKDKWGYFGTDGSQIIDFVCEPFYNSVSFENDSILDCHLAPKYNDSSMQTVSDEYGVVYMATDGFIPVKIDGQYGYYDTEGNVAVSLGTFSDVRPFHNNLAWVKDNKTELWGVIEISEGSAEPKPVTTTTTATTTLVTTTTQNTATTVKSEVTTVPNTSPAADVLYGDANCDGNVNIGDVIAIRQYLEDSAKWGLSEQGLRNADVYKPGSGVDENDALAIELYDKGEISSLPVYSLPSETETVAYDTNRDGKFDLLDCMDILMYYTYVSTGGDPSGSERYSDIAKYGDANNDGIINAKDAETMISEYLNTYGYHLLTEEEVVSHESRLYDSYDYLYYGKTINELIEDLSGSDIIPSSYTVAGDANLDDKVSLADAVAVLQYIANKDKYSLTEQGKINADVYGGGDGITANDALSIQKYDAKILKSLPES